MEREGLDRLIVQHASFPEALVRLVDAVPDRLLRARESDARWSPLEILAHLLDEEHEDFRPRAQAAAVGGRIDQSIDPARWVVERAYNTQDPGAVLHDFAAERVRSCEWLRSLDVTALDRSLEHVRLGTMRCGDFVAAWRMHDLLHLRQLSTALAVLGARELAGWRIDYAGKIPGVPAG
jgi:hypothetical protein